MSDEAHTHTPEDLEAIRRDVKQHCRLHNIYERIFRVREDLKNIEDDLLNYALEPLYQKLFGNGSSPERIKTVLRIVNERDRTDFDQDDLDNLKNLGEDLLPDLESKKKIEAT